MDPWAMPAAMSATNLAIYRIPHVVINPAPQPMAAVPGDRS